MNDPIATARSARETLSRGLSALQGDPSLPPAVQAVVPHIAQAMAALHAIERSGGQGGPAAMAPQAETALQRVRAALSELQTHASVSASVGTAVEAVAGSLSLVHGLQRSFAAPGAPGPARGAAVDPFASTSAAPQAKAIPQPAPAPPAGDLPVMEAPLGTHSPTNFYKGLSGNDIIEHGGLFVATYAPPKVGTRLRLKVSLPGGYEFEANAQVAWLREHSEGSDAPPGFGARFTDITPEARQLVYRYTRNREPLFHDDL